MSEPKKIEIQEVQRDDRRGAFRRTQTQAHRLSLSVHTAAGEDLVGTFRDLTIRGASATFVVNPNQITVGQSVVLTIGSLTRTTRVVAVARVVFSVDASGGRLCGFQFTDHAALVPQIDSFFARYFNRRRALRVSVPLDRKIPVFLFHSGNEIPCELIDLSTDGMQVRSTRAMAKGLDDANHAFVRLTLPGQKEEIRGRAAILRRTHQRGMMTFGLSFDLLQKDGFASHSAALQAWVSRRAEEIAKWDRALTKPETPSTPLGSVPGKDPGAKAADKPPKPNAA